MAAARIIAQGLWSTRIDARAGLLARLDRYSPSELLEAFRLVSYWPLAALLCRPLQAPRPHASQLARSETALVSLSLRALEK